MFAFVTSYILRFSSEKISKKGKITQDKYVK